MSIILKRHYWGFKQYNTRTGLYKGDTYWSTQGITYDWKGRKVKEDNPSKFRSKV